MLGSSYTQLWGLSNTRGSLCFSCERIYLLFPEVDAAQQQLKLFPLLVVSHLDFTLFSFTAMCTVEHYTNAGEYQPIQTWNICVEQSSKYSSAMGLFCLLGQAQDLSWVPWSISCFTVGLQNTLITIHSNLQCFKGVKWEMPQKEIWFKSRRK